MTNVTVLNSLSVTAWKFHNIALFQVTSRYFDMQIQKKCLLYIVLMIFKVILNYICTAYRSVDNKHPESLQKDLFKTIILEIELIGCSTLYIFAFVYYILVYNTWKYDVI